RCGRVSFASCRSTRSLWRYRIRKTHWRRSNSSTPRVDTWLLHSIHLMIWRSLIVYFGWAMCLLKNWDEMEENPLFIGLTGESD
ncbi:hypothetical protein PENTCL1PPCAC_19019, partial [Pristionchus entomophagus]